MPCNSCKVTTLKMWSLEFLPSNFFSRVIWDSTYAALHAQNYPKTLLGLNRWIPVHRILGATRLLHPILFFFFFKKSGVTVVFRCFVGLSKFPCLVQLVLLCRGQCLFLLERGLPVFFGSSLPPPTSVGFYAFSFLSVALYVSCSIFSIFALSWMTQKYITWRIARFCKRSGNNERWTGCSILDCLNGVRPSYSFVTLSWSLKTSGALLITHTDLSQWLYRKD